MVRESQGVDKAKPFVLKCEHFLCGNGKEEPLDQTPTPYGVHPFKKRAVATGVCSSGFFSPVLRTTAGAASGAARKKTASRYGLRP